MHRQNDRSCRGLLHGLGGKPYWLAARALSALSAKGCAANKRPGSFGKGRGEASDSHHVGLTPETHWLILTRST